MQRPSSEFLKFVRGKRYHVPPPSLPLLTINALRYGIFSLDFIHEVFYDNCPDRAGPL
jgi:hypothetical protein